MLALAKHSRYDKRPRVDVDGDDRLSVRGWREIGERLRAAGTRPGAVIAVECYPGVLLEEGERALAEQLRPAALVRSGEALRPPAELERMVRPFLTDDPVFGRMNELEVEDLWEPSRAAELRRQVSEECRGLTLVSLHRTRMFSFTPTWRAGKSSSGSAGTRSAIWERTTGARLPGSNTSGRSSSIGAWPTG
jgi:hypothetical protein